MASLVRALLQGLEDYSIDERGDVGSWVRLASIQGLTTVARLLFANSKCLPNFEDYLPPSIYIQIVSGVLKQGVERLDNVRQEAGKQFMELLDFPLPDVEEKERWMLPEWAQLRALFEA